MIRADFFLKADGKITGFSLSGHAGGENGYDIVCAAVSSAAYMTANTLTEILGLPAEVDVDEDEGFLELHLKSSDAKTASPVLEGFRLHIKELSLQYPENITLKEVQTDA